MGNPEPASEHDWKFAGYADGDEVWVCRTCGESKEVADV